MDDVKKSDTFTVFAAFCKEAFSHIPPESSLSWLDIHLTPWADMSYLHHLRAVLQAMDVDGFGKLLPKVVHICSPPCPTAPAVPPGSSRVGRSGSVSPRGLTRTPAARTRSSPPVGRSGETQAHASTSRQLQSLAHSSMLITSRKARMYGVQLRALE